MGCGGVAYGEQQPFQFHWVSSNALTHTIVAAASYLVQVTQGGAANNGSSPLTLEFLCYMKEKEPSCREQSKG